MRVELSQASAAVQEAIDGARQNPDIEAADIVNEVIAKLGGEAVHDAETKKAAEHRLQLAADGIDALGEVPEAPAVNAMIGIGLAILAGGQDAEVFFADALATSFGHEP